MYSDNSFTSQSVTSVITRDSEATEKSPDPPPLPLDLVYTANWCEENIYLLVERFLEDEQVRGTWSVYANFISNDNHSVALWCQKQREDVVVWDYHVILALKPRVGGARTGRRPEHTESVMSMPKPMQKGATWIYDLDSRLEMPCCWEDYFAQTFPYATSEAVEAGWTNPDTYQSLFRIVDGDEFLAGFASDRSHMLVSEPGPPRYQSPEPPYACIRGAKAAALGISNNLMSSLVNMDVENREIGSVYTLEEAKTHFGSYF